MKDAFYFPHDSNAKDDPKIVHLIDALGLEGYGIFWVLIEILRDQPNFTYPIKLVPSIARRYNTSIQKVISVINDYELFFVENNNFFYSKSLIERMIPLQQRREKNRKAGLASAQVRMQKALQPFTNSTSVEQTFNGCSTDVQQMSNGCSTDVQHDSNECSTSKVKESKVKESKEKESKVNESNEPRMAIVSLLMSHFNFSETSNFDKLRIIDQFAHIIQSTGRVDYFNAQFDAYNRFKAQTNQIRHGFKSFIGTVDNQFSDGGWDAENWAAKLAEISDDNTQTDNQADRVKSLLNKNVN